MLTNERAFAEGLAREAGTIIRSHFGFGIAKTWKGDGTPVTAADQAVNDLVVERIQKHFPDHGIIAEEGAPPLTGQKNIWVCDPIDGTIPFTQGIPVVAFALALVCDGIPTLGVAYDPLLDRLFIGEKGKGATFNGTPIRVSTTSSFKGAPIHGMLWKQHNAISGVTKELSERGANATNLISCVYSATIVATGGSPVVMYAGTFPWDGSVPKILVEEAGGCVTDLFGNDQRYDGSIRGFLATNGAMHEEMVSLIGRHLTPETFAATSEK